MSEFLQRLLTGGRFWWCSTVGSVGNELRTMNALQRNRNGHGIKPWGRRIDICKERPAPGLVSASVQGRRESTLMKICAKAYAQKRLAYRNSSFAATDRTRRRLNCLCMLNERYQLGSDPTSNWPCFWLTPKEPRSGQLFPTWKLPILMHRSWLIA